jgi:hypothetical protein
MVIEIEPLISNLNLWLNRKKLAGLGDTPRHQGDTAPAKQLELGLEPRLALLSVSLFSSDTIIALQTKHRTHSVQDGISLTNEKDNQTYSIMSSSNSIKAGERMTLKGLVVATDGSGNPKFQIQGLIKDYGACGQGSASNWMSPSSRSLN